MVIKVFAAGFHLLSLEKFTCFSHIVCLKKRENAYGAALKQDLVVFQSFIFFTFVCGCSIRKIQLLTSNVMKALAVNFISYQLCYCVSTPVKGVGCQRNVVLLVGSYTYSMNSDLFANSDS